MWSRLIVVVEEQGQPLVRAAFWTTMRETRGLRRNLAAAL
jgi:hypothetical protein